MLSPEGYEFDRDDLPQYRGIPPRPLNDAERIAAGVIGSLSDGDSSREHTEYLIGLEIADIVDEVVIRNLREWYTLLHMALRSLQNETDPVKRADLYNDIDTAKAEIEQWRELLSSPENL